MRYNINTHICVCVCVEYKQTDENKSYGQYYTLQTSARIIEGFSRPNMGGGVFEGTRLVSTGNLWTGAIKDYAMVFNLFK